MANTTPSWLNSFFGALTIQEENVDLPQRSKISIQGPDVTASDDPENLRTVIAFGGATPIANAGTGELNDVTTLSGGAPASSVGFTGVAPKVNGLASGSAGRRLVVTTARGPLVLSNQNGASTAANRIVTGTGADVTIANGGAALVVYDAVASRWRLASGAGVGPKGDGTAVRPMGDADKTLSVSELSKSIIELTGALTAPRNVNTSTAATTADSYVRTFVNSCTGRQVLIGPTGATRRVPLFPGVRATIRITPTGAELVVDKPLDPRDFGCPWDGVNDDQPAFQAMLNSLPIATDDPYPVTIQLPMGRGYFGDNVLVRRPVTIKGHGGLSSPWNEKGSSGVYTSTPHDRQYGTVVLFAPLRGFTTYGITTSGDSGSATWGSFEDFEVNSLRPQVSSGAGFGPAIYCIDPNYDSRVASKFYGKGRCVLRAGTTKTGAGVYDEGATRGGTRVMFRATNSGTTAAGGDPAAFAAATVASIGTTIVDGGVTWVVESIPKDYALSTAYVLGERVVLPGDNLGVFECIVAGTSLGAGTNTNASNGIGVRCPDAMANAFPGEEFLDNPGNPSGLKWRSTTPCAFTILTTGTRIERVSIRGFMGFGIHVTSEAAPIGSGTAIHVDTNWVHLRDYNIWHCGGGVRFRGTDSNGCLNLNGNHLHLGAGRTNVDAAAYLNLLPTLKWGNGGNAIVDRALSGMNNINQYAQFADAPAWRNDNLGGSGFASRFDRCIGESLYESIIRGPTCLAMATYPLGAAETGGVILDPTWGRGITERDLPGYSAKRVAGGICAQWGTGGMHWFKSDVDEFSAVAFGWSYQETNLLHFGNNNTQGSAGTGWYGLSYGPFYKRMAYAVSGVKAAEGHCFFRFHRGYFGGNETNGSWYQGLDASQKKAIAVRNGTRNVGDRFKIKSTGVAGTWDEEIVAIAGTEGGLPFTSYASQVAIISQSPSSPFQIDSVAIYADHIESGGKIIRAVGSTGAGTHNAVEPSWAALVTIGNQVTHGNVTYRYVGNVPTYVRASFVDDRFSALTPQTRRRWADTAGTDASAPAPNSAVESVRSNTTTSATTANQVLATYALTANRSYVVDVVVAGRIASSTNFSTAKLSGAFTQNGGTITRAGTDDNVAKSSGTLAGTTFDLNISGANLQVRTTPAAATFTQWAVTITVTEVSS